MKHLYLLGMPAAGKTTTGRKIAAELKLPFYDLDELFGEAYSSTPANYIAYKGETAFRKLEAEILRNTRLLVSGVVACGGGTPCFHRNMKWMNESGITLFLDTPLEEVEQRISRNGLENPILKATDAANLEDKLQKLYSKRRPFYEESQLIAENGVPSQLLYVVVNQLLKL